MSWLSLGFVLAFACLSGCMYHPRIPPGAIACVTSADCPDPGDQCVPIPEREPPLSVCCHDCASRDGGTDQISCPEAKGGPSLVPVGDVCIDETEVTNAQYAVFWTAMATGRDVSNQIPVCAWNTSYTPDIADSPWPFLPGTELRPVVNVDWCDAFAFCQWAGKRLCGGRHGHPLLRWEQSTDPAVAEWVYACTEGGKRMYPYGDTFDATACNTGQTKESATVLVDVASKSACRTASGVYDLSGNVEEWTDSCTGTAGEQDMCAVIGQSAFHDVANDLSCVHSPYGDARSVTYELRGFRCCAP